MIPKDIQAELLKEFDKKFPNIMSKHKISNFPSGAFYDIKELITQTAEAVRKEVELNHATCYSEKDIIIAKQEAYRECADLLDERGIGHMKEGFMIKSDKGLRDKYSFMALEDREVAEMLRDKANTK